MKRNIFLVHTPFQLMNCLNIIEKFFTTEKNDIVFLHRNLLKYEDSLKNFSDNLTIYFYPKMHVNFKKKNLFIVKYELLKKLFFGKALLNNVLNKFYIYHTIFIPSENVDCNIIYNHFKKINPLLKLNVYDDGVGTYAKGYLSSNGYIIYKFFSNVFFGLFFWDVIEKLYCYLPNAIYNSNDKIKILKIDSISKVENLLTSDLQSGLIDLYKDSRIIFLDQGHLPLSNFNMKTFFDFADPYFNNNEIVIKNHPRILPSHNFTNYKIDSSGVSFESIFFKVEMSKKILVSNHSTSCLTPFLLKKQQPYVIFLGMMYSNDLLNIFESKYFQSIINSYDLNKIFIPKNMNQLKIVIESLSKKNIDTLSISI